MTGLGSIIGTSGVFVSMGIAAGAAGSAVVLSIAVAAVVAMGTEGRTAFRLPREPGRSVTGCDRTFPRKTVTSTFALLRAAHGLNR